MSSRRGARPQIKSHTNPRKAQRMWVFGNRISRIDTCVTRPYSSLSQIQKSRPVDSRVCFLYARFIYKTKRLIAPQHNRLIVFNSSFSKLYRDVGIFSGQSNIPCMGIRCIAWCPEGCGNVVFASCKLFVIWHWNVLYGALKSILWHGRNWFEKKCLWLHSSDINVWWANCSSCMAIMAIRISSEFWSMTLRRLPRRSFRQNPLAETPIIFWDGSSRTFWAMFLLVFPTKIKSAEKAARNDPGNRIG